MGGGKGSSSYSQMPLTPQELALVSSQKSSTDALTSLAQQAGQRSADTNQIWKDNYLPVELGKTDPSTGLWASTVGSNDGNRLATNAFLSGSKSNADNFNIGNGLLNGLYANRVAQASNDYGNNAMQSARDTAGQIGGYANDYNNFMGGINSSMGTADEGVLGRLRAQNISGLSTANDGASRGLMAQLAQRGLTNSGVGVKSMEELNNNYQQQLGSAQANSYNQAIQQSDAMRNNQVNLNNQRLQGMVGASQSAGGAIGGAIDKQYQAQLGSLGTGYGAYGSALQNMYNTNVAQQGSALNAISSNNQQNMGNLTNYAQLGRGMAGMSSNYLGQAGSMYGSAAQASQNGFNGLTGANNNYNQLQYGQQNASNAAKGQSASGMGQMAMTGAMMMSDKRLKDNITKIGTIGKLNLYTWVWNKEAERIGANHAPAIGVIAQEVQELYPDAVAEQGDRYLGVDYNKVIAYAKESV